jgi:hypothetical protein
LGLNGIDDDGAHGHILSTRKPPLPKSPSR